MTGQVHRHREFDRYCEAARERLAAAGAAPAEVFDDLRGHVEREAAAAGLPALTRDDLEQILRRIGPLTEAEPVPERAAAAPAVPAQPSAPPGCFDASRGGTRLRVCESIRDSAGGEWTDVSSWYWAALLGRSSGPWWATTVAERTPPGP